MHLLEPTIVGTLTLPNRIVMAPLTRRRASHGKLANELMARYYAQRAGAGLIISESTEIDPRANDAAPTRPGMFTQRHATAWRGVTAAVHGAGGRMFVQLSHLGRATHASTLVPGADVVGPSAIAAAGQAFTPQGWQPYPLPRALTVAEIHGIVAQFGRSAALALEAGFDGVEVHGANGYLIDQFTRSGSNQRDDDYGGTAAKRVRFLAEVVAAVAAVVGRERVGVRLSPWTAFNGMSDADPAATFGAAVDRLRDLGVAYLHLVRAESPVAADDALLAQLRRGFGGTVILAQNFDVASAEAALAAGAADLVAFGRAFIANPDLPRRIALGAPLNAPQPETFYTGGERGYVDYPALEPGARG